MERRNRTVVSMARSFLKEMKMPPYLWGEAIRHSVYVLNRLPTRVLIEKTPYEAWTGNKPDLSHLRTFGCVAYMKVPSNQISKLDDRSRMLVYLGRDPGTKGYRLLEPDSGKILVSRDVVYDETKTWQWDKQQRDNEAPHGSFAVFGLQGTSGDSEFSVQKSSTLADGENSGENSGGDSSGHGLTSDHSLQTGEGSHMLTVSSPSSSLTGSIVSSPSGSSSCSTEPNKF